MKTINQEQLDEILAKHYLWLKTVGEKGERADLSHTDLMPFSLRGVNLKRADLSYANLSNVDLTSADLSFATLVHTNLYGAKLDESSLHNADLSFANMTSSSLSWTILKGANLKGARLDYSTFPLWCGGLDIHIDETQANQLLYHFLQNVSISKNISDEYRKAVMLEPIIEKANSFHRASECGKIEPLVEEVTDDERPYDN